MPLVGRVCCFCLILVIAVIEGAFADRVVVGVIAALVLLIYGYTFLRFFLRTGRLQPYPIWTLIAVALFIVVSKMAWRLRPFFDIG